jgi:hypothetical protein
MKVPYGKQFISKNSRSRTTSPRIGNREAISKGVFGPRWQFEFGGGLISSVNIRVVLHANLHRDQYFGKSVVGLTGVDFSRALGTVERMSVEHDGKREPKQ